MNDKQKADHKEVLRKEIARLKKLLLILSALGLVAALPLLAQSGTTTNVVNVNIGDPADASFYFERTPGSYTDSDVLIAQCDRNRAWFISHLGVYNEYQASQFFDINCSSNVSRNSIGQRVIGYTVLGTPFTVHLTPQNIDLTVDSASWQSTEQGCGRSGSDCFKNGQGTATVSQ